jgi:hypothetical protein
VNSSFQLNILESTFCGSNFQITRIAEILSPVHRTTPEVDTSSPVPNAGPDTRTFLLGKDTDTFCSSGKIVGGAKPVAVVELGPLVRELPVIFLERQPLTLIGPLFLLERIVLKGGDAAAPNTPPLGLPGIPSYEKEAGGKIRVLVKVSSKVLWKGM